MQHYRAINKCRICSSASRTEVINISEQFLSPTFVKDQKSDISKIKVPLTLVLCDRKAGGCGLLQLKETTNPDLLYRNYFYRSATSTTMRTDLKDVVDDVMAKAGAEEGDAVIDVGANDCTMISYFPASMRRVAVEPAKNIEWSHVDKSIAIVNDYFTKEAVSAALGAAKAQIITCTAMFYDLDDPNKFVADVESVIADDGVWCIQLSYLLSMLRNMNFYDICHEHLEYYSLHVLDSLMRRHGLFIFDGSLNHVNGGSARVFVAHIGGRRKRTPEIERLFAEELETDLYDATTYRDFYSRIEDLASRVRGYILNQTRSGNLVLGLGASTKGNVLLQLFGIGKDVLPFISERNPDKVGLRTLGTDIELISEEHARDLKPSCMLVLPWYFKDEIVKRENEYIMGGGQLLFPMPYAHIVSRQGETNI